MKKLILLTLLLPSVAFAQGLSHTNVALYNSGGNARVVPSAVVTVCAAADPQIPCTTKVSIFTNYQLTSALANPFNADANGNYSFYAGAGNYTVTVTGIGITGLSYQITLGVGTPSSLAGPGTITGTFGGNFTTTGNNTHSGTETFQNVIQLSGGTCSVAGLQAAITAVTPVGGRVDATACTTISTNITNATGSITIPSNVTVLLGPSTWTCTITTVSTPCWNLSGAKSPQLIGAGGGGGIEINGSDPAVAAANGVTNLVCSSCGTTTDMVLVENPTRTGILSNYVVASPIVRGLWINMGGSGREGLYSVGSDDGVFEDFKIYNAVCPAAPCGAFHFAAGVSTDSPAFSQAYRNRISGFIAQAMASNSTGASCFLDARYGEIAYGDGMFNFRCSGNIVNGGGLYGGLIQASNGGLPDSLDTFAIHGGYFGNPIASASSYHLRMEAPGNWLAATGGRIFNVTISDVLFERIFTSATGTALGCTSGGSSNGAGCGEIHLYNISVTFGNITTAIDNLTTNTPMGAPSILGVLGSQNGGHPVFLSSGSIYGANAQSWRTDTTWQAGANGQSAIFNFSVPSINTATFTGLNATHYNADIGDGTYTGSGTITKLQGFNCNGTFGGLHTVTGEQTTCFSESGGNPNNFDGPFEFVETTAPPGLAGADKCYGDSTAHALKCSYNNGTFSNVDLTSNTSTTATQVLHASTTAGIGTWSAIATGDLPVAIPLANVGSAGLSATAPIRIAATGVIDCAGAAQCVTSAAALTNNVMVKGAGAQATQTSLETDDGTTMTYTGTGGYSAPRLISTVSTGTAPLTVTSTTAVANLKVQNLSAVSGGDLPSAAGGTDVGSTALPYGNLWLGTAATNNFKFQPATTSGARVVTVADPLSPTTVALPLTIGNGTSTMASGSVAAATCATAVTTAATGVLTTDSIEWAYATAPTLTTDALLHISPYVTAGNVNFTRCNPTAGAIVGTAIVINWRVVR